MNDETADEVEVRVDTMLLRQLEQWSAAQGSQEPISDHETNEQNMQRWAYRAYLLLVPLEVLLRQGREQEHNLSLDDGMDVGGLAELSMAGVRTREASVERRPTPPPLEAVLKMRGGAKKRVWVHDAPKPSWTVSTLQSPSASATRPRLLSAASNRVA